MHGSAGQALRAAAACAPLPVHFNYCIAFFDQVRSYGNENWEFAADGLMQRRFACINDMPIAESERKYHWPLGRRPDDHPGLSELGL